MTTFKDYLRDVHQEDMIQESFDDWLNFLEGDADKLGELFMEYLGQIYVSRKIGKIAYIVLENQ